MRITDNGWTIKVGFLLLSLCACKSPSQQILDEFNKVNASLDSSNKAIDARMREISNDDYKYYYTLVKKKAGKNPVLARQADSLLAAIDEAVTRIRATSDVLRDKDPTGDNTTISQRLLVHTPLGDSLRISVEQMIRHSESVCAGFEKNYSIDSVISDIKEITIPKHWYHDNFPDQPSVATLVILNALESDCKKAAVMVFKQIDANL
jgi:hypothetical protein